MVEILTTATDLELEVNEDDIEELIMGHEEELTTEELQETQRNVSPSEQEDERGPMPTSAIKDLLKNLRYSSPLVLEVRLRPQPVSSAFGKYTQVEGNADKFDMEKILANLRSDSLDSMDELFPRIKSSLIGECTRFAHDSPYFSPTPLVLGDNSPARLNPTLTTYLVRHLDGYKSPCPIDIEGMSLSTQADIPFHSNRSWFVCARVTPQKIIFT
ncbi:uncharacterized protein TNCV_1611371 [Trichonephila clavipes]|nr:uncharacterized protein TNCV_1611371 [Trichonephila clavipes]